MTHEEQLEICRAIVVSCMWGHGGIRSVILEELDKAIPMEPSWSQVSRENSGRFRREHMGVITDEAELRRYLEDGYWLVNGDSLFNPPPMNGLCKYVAKDLYDRFARPLYQQTVPRS